jgi:hypothetical protein
MERIITASHSSSFDLDVASRLYNRLNELPALWFAASRMKLPCIALQLPSFSAYRTRSGRVYRADTLTFGMVEIKTRYDLSRMNSLYLVHPWLDTLLEHEGMQSGVFVEDDVVPVPLLSPNADDEEICDDAIDDDSSSFPEPEPSSLPAPALMVPMNRETRARRLVARLHLVHSLSRWHRRVDVRWVTGGWWLIA